jgi:hypothetical protein
VERAEIGEVFVDARPDAGDPVIAEQLPQADDAIALEGLDVARMDHDAPF